MLHAIQPAGASLGVLDDDAMLERALLIRTVEEAFLRLFSEGRLNGTVHTCIGQELSALAFAGRLEPGDVVFSNHRCHGHFIAKTGDYAGLIAELLGRASGVCGGVGSSQHLHAPGFFSNGVQGGIVPVAAGVALAAELRAQPAIVTAFIGDGTLGEGVVYETLNIAALWSLPLLIVCEDNGIAQTTPGTLGIAGDPAARAAAVGMRTFAVDTNAPDDLFAGAAEAIAYVRGERKPAFVHVQTQRLGPHSKGDDTRDPAHIASLRAADPLDRARSAQPERYDLIRARVQQQVDAAIAAALAEGEIDLARYMPPEPGPEPLQWQPLVPDSRRTVEAINAFFLESMEHDDRIVFVGEDVLSPYGGAFKAARGLSERFPERVITTPISEAAIAGVGNGLALAGMRPFVELMFGDFTTLAMDQIVNHAAKFQHMYLHAVRCPVTFRAPMGGRRGYGPTHSQTLDKLLIGLDNVDVVALNALIDPGDLYRDVLAGDRPAFVIENKLDYGKRLTPPPLGNFIIERSSGRFPIVRARPARSKPTVTIVTYGGMAEHVLAAVEPLVREAEELAEVFVLSRIHPLHLDAVYASLEATGALVIVEEGSTFAGFGAEVAARVAEQAQRHIRIVRVGALPVPIPSVKSLESQVLPDTRSVIDAVIACKRRSRGSVAETLPVKS
ncbi:MAG: alpha-ketoacid dehydrogenase subunit alpha/beta [Candidatus Velthaea sp.]